MEKRSGVFFFAVVAVASAMVLPEDQVKHMVQSKVKPSPCCFPDAFEAQVSQFVGYHRQQRAGLVQDFITMSYDATSKKIALDQQLIINGVPQKLKIILDYNIQRVYLIHPDKCTYEPHPEEFQKSCVPDNATLVGEVTMGLGDEALLVNTWNYQIPVGENEGFDVFVTVTPTQCAPISALVFGEAQSVQALLFGGFVNLSLGIKDPSVFDPPEGCQPGPKQGTAAPHNPLMNLMKALF